MRQSLSFVWFRWLCIGFFTGFSGNAIFAQNQKSDVHHLVSVRLSYQLLHSTHRTDFNGAGIDVNRLFSNRWAAGLGVQYAATPHHPDNGWMLTRMRLKPVYVNGIYWFKTKHAVQPYLHSEAGISFNHYHKRYASSSPLGVSETGLYLSQNVGARFVVSPNMRLFVEAGYKGYKHSFNNLDVNPHGLTIRAGIEI